MFVGVLFCSIKLQKVQGIICPDNLTKFVSDVHLRYIQLGSVTTASGGGGGGGGVGGVFAGMSDWHLGRHSSDSFGIARHTSLGGARQPGHAWDARHPG